MVINNKGVILSWNKIASDLLNSNTAYDNLQLSFPGNDVTVFLPNIIKLTLKLLEEAWVKGINKTIVVYPEKIYLPALTVIFQAFSDITSGNQDNNNDFNALQKGQRLKIDNHVCEFISSNKERIWVKWADVDNSFLKNNFPAFQKADTKRRLSKHPGKLLKMNNNFSVIDILKQNLSFQKKSIIYISSESKFSKATFDLGINCSIITDLLLLGRIRTDNSIDIINKGQIHGIPAILFNYDLDYLNMEHIKNASSLFIDYSDNIINTKLPSLDRFLNTGIPITVLTDTINSFNMEDLENRGFKTLRWDKDSLIPELSDEKTENLINYKIFNCFSEKIIYELCESNDISILVKKMISIRNFIENTNQNIIDLYWLIYEKVILMLRNIITFSTSYKSIISDKLDNINIDLAKYKYNLSPEIIKSIQDILLSLHEFLKETYKFEKTRKTEKLIQLSSYENIIIIISENDDKNEYISYFNSFIEELNVKKIITIMYPMEYSANLHNISAEVIVCGWLGKTKMRNVIFCNNSNSVHILLNNIELKWKKLHCLEWEKIIKNESRQNFDRAVTTLDITATDSTEVKDVELLDDIDNIEIIIRENRYRKYLSQYAGNITTEAIPITFISGYFSFYKKSSDIITVTDIINDYSEGSKAIIKEATEIHVGDFVVIRETERSLIRELADEILSNEGKKEYREISGRWKNKLLEKCKFSSVIELHERIKKEGSTIGLQAFRSWINNDDFIAPQDKDNLLYIASALNDNYLINNIDNIFDVCRYVKTAHVRAGNEISSRLKKGIADALSELPDLDKTDVWDPIDLQLDELGKVKILKIISIGNPVLVDIIHTNRLLTESPRDKYQIEGRSAREVFINYELGPGDCKAKGFIPDENKIYRRTK